MALVKIENTRMSLETDPNSIAGTIPIVPGDKLWVESATYRCFAKYGGGSGMPVKIPYGHFVGSVKPTAVSNLTDLVQGQSWFRVLALSSGDGYEIPLVAVEAKPLCLACSKVMPKIGHARANGANHPDWPSRAFHKACWKAM